MLTSNSNQSGRFSSLFMQNKGSSLEGKVVNMCMSILDCIYIFQKSIDYSRFQIIVKLNACGIVECFHF